MEGEILSVALVGFVAFHQWLRHQRRVLVHKERLAAIEKGVELPPLEQEVRRRSFSVQRMLLLMGMIWIVMGIAMFVTLSIVIPNLPPGTPDAPPQGTQFAAIAPIGIGLAHLITYRVGRKSESD